MAFRIIVVCILLAASLIVWGCIAQDIGIIIIGAALLWACRICRRILGL